MAEAGLLKFVERGQTSPTNIGIKTFPHQTFGVSRESPDHFQQRHTIINPQGYFYKHEKAPEFEYRSQHKTIMLDHPPAPEKKNNCQPHHEHNPLKFHLKKGRLAEFWDKNSWMNTIYVMNGFQRSKRSRDISNMERTMRIKSQRKPVQYESHLACKPKIRKDGLLTKEELMSEKVRIRSRRNQEAKRQIPLSQRKLEDTEASLVDIETIKSKMIQTTTDWHKGGKKSKVSRDISWREPVLAKLESEELGMDNLQEWQRKTCKSKWCYKVANDNNNQQDVQFK